MIKNGVYTLIPCYECFNNGYMEVVQYQGLFAGMSMGYFDLNGNINKNLVNATNDEYFTEHIKILSDMVIQIKN